MHSSEQATMQRIIGVLVLIALLLVGAPGRGHAAANGCPDATLLPPTPFRDVVGTTHQGSVVCADWYDIVNGTARDAFSPRRAVRRDQMATMLARMLATAEVPLPSEPPRPFTDVGSGVHRDAIAVVTAIGVIDGAEDTFRPQARVTRGDVATWLVRLAGVLDVTAVDPPDAFPDDDGTLVEDAVNQAAALRLVRGHADGAFRADELVRRDQAAAFLSRMVRVLVHRSLLKDRPIPPYAARRTPLPNEMRRQMTGATWRSGCPVALDDLVLLRVTHWDYAATPRRGHLIVAHSVAAEVTSVFERLYRARFQIRRMRPVHTYDGGEAAALDDNNTSAFNCRRVTGGQRFSEHSYGTAIDINPRQNPYVRGATVLPRDAGAWVRRSPVRRGMIGPRGAVVSAFDDIGWEWGGRWRSLKDYQHFSASGR
jgi:hypothetical protein